MRICYLKCILYINDVELNKIGDYVLPLKVSNIDIVKLAKHESVANLDNINFICGLIRNIHFDDLDNRIRFLIEQLSYFNLNKHYFRYSTDRLIFASLSREGRPLSSRIIIAKSVSRPSIMRRIA